MVDRDIYRYPLVWVMSGSSTTYVALPTPTDYKMTSTTIVDSARNSDGYVVASVIREGIRKVEISWNFLNIQQFSAIAQLFDSHYGGSFNFKAKFFDTIVGDFVSGVKMYVGDRITDTAKIQLVNGKPVGYVDVSLSLIEV